MKVTGFDKSRVFFWRGGYKSQIGVGARMGKEERATVTADNLSKRFVTKGNKERRW